MVEIKEGDFLSIPSSWIFLLKGEDLKRACLLRWRFTYFASVSPEGSDKSLCFFQSQSSLCQLFGMSEASRTKVGKCIGRLKDAGALLVREGKVMVDGRIKPRHYLIPNDKFLLDKYNIQPDKWETLPIDMGDSPEYHPKTQTQEDV